MTKLDLICEEPYLIGLIGSISFISLSLGSIALSKAIDKYGRKSTVLSTGLIALVGLLILQFSGKNNNLTLIYAITFALGFVYITRQSVCYLHAVELMEQQHKMHVSTFSFMFSGSLQMLSALWFYYSKD